MAIIDFSETRSESSRRYGAWSQGHDLTPSLHRAEIGAAPASATFSCTLALPSPGRFALVAGGLILLALCLSGIAGIAHLGGETAASKRLMTLFWVGAERNVPTFLNFKLLAIAAALMVLTGMRAAADASPWRWHWLVLAATLLLLAFDEAASLHEMLGSFVRMFVAPEGIFRFSWVIVALPLVAIFALAYLRFLGNLPRRTALMMLAAGTAYVGGGIGVEMLNSALFDAAGGRRTVTYAVFTMVEEGLEMTGIALLSVAVLSHLAMQRPAR